MGLLCKTELVTLLGRRSESNGYWELALVEGGL
jgi:hypothetical protein